MEQNRQTGDRYAAATDFGGLGANGRKVRFGLVLSEEFSLLAFSSFVEVLRQVEDHGQLINTAYCEWFVLGESTASAVRSSSGIVVAPTARYADVGALDFVVVVGGRRASAIGPAAENFLRRAAGNAIIVALDTAIFAIARLQLFDDRRCCVHWFHYHEFIDEFPHIVASMDVIFLIDRNFISCAGGTWAADLASYLVTRIWAESDAQRAITIMGLERMRSASHYQSPFYDRPLVHDTEVQMAIQLIERRSSHPPSVTELANEVGLSPRQLERRFAGAVGMRPLEFSRFLRLRLAHSLLRRSRRPLSQIAFDCGFSDQSHFTRHFKAMFGRTPQRLRAAGGDELAPMERSIPAFAAPERRVRV